MNVREHLLALHEELRRLKADGQRRVIVNEASLAQLRSAVQTAVAEAGGAGAASVGVVATEVPVAGVGVAEPPAAVFPPERPTARPSPPPVATPTERKLPPPPAVTLPPGDKQSQWNALRELVLNDPICKANVRPGKQVVLGVGQLDAKLFFCGEAPGAEEEVQGEPFVGPAGQLLTKMIQAMGLKRESVYIGNIMNWRPQLPAAANGEQYGNRPPTQEEMEYCLPYLRAQLAIVQPQLIVALGKTAAEGLLGFGSFRAVGEIRGKWKEFGGVPLLVTYHPSYILRNQSNSSKRQIWEDLLKVMERAGLPISDKQRGYFL